MKTYELINFGSGFLKDNRILSNRIDAEILLSYVMGVSREKLLIDEKNVKQDKIKNLNTKTRLRLLKF